MRVRACMHVCVCVYVRACMHTCIRTHVCVCACICVGMSWLVGVNMLRILVSFFT